jgi:hypothetical protein
VCLVLICTRGVVVGYVSTVGHPSQRPRTILGELVFPGCYVAVGGEVGIAFRFGVHSERPSPEWFEGLTVPSPR